MTFLRFYLFTLTYNGTFQPTPSPAQPCAGRTLKVDVTTDTYPGETSWTLTNTCTGETTEAVDQNTMYTAKSTPYSKEYCVAEAAYEFTINDSYGDGNCCDYGSGSYSVTYGDDEVAFGGQFASSESTPFGSCVSATPELTKAFDCSSILRRRRCREAGSACVWQSQKCVNV